MKVVSEINERWLLKARPRWEITSETFQWDTKPVRHPEDGEVLIRTLWLSCDPTQRTWLSAEENYLPPVELGLPMRAVGAGTIIESRHPGYAAGEIVVGILSWETHVTLLPTGLHQLTKISPDISLQHAVWALSPSGLAAYFGMIEVARPVEGDTVVISGAAGATGSLAGQIAKIMGCRVVGVAGGREKCKWLTDVAGFDHAINYKAEQVDQRLAMLCPNGINVFFDNVGGKILDCAIEQMAVHGRVVICGAIAQYNLGDAAPGPRRYLDLWRKRIRIEGFLVLDYLARQNEMLENLLKWLADGKIAYRADVQVGLASAPDALLRLFSGANRGKQLIRVANT